MRYTLPDKSIVVDGATAFVQVAFPDDPDLPVIGVHLPYPYSHYQLKQVVEAKIEALKPIIAKSDTRVVEFDKTLEYVD